MLIREMLKTIGMLDPYAGYDASQMSVDQQGWGSDHHYFPTLVGMVKPRQIIEVGSWKGASAINMAQHARQHVKDVSVLCIDTWLCSNEVLWTDPELRKLYKLQNGYPNVYQQFMANIMHVGLTNTIYPLPMTSISAAEMLEKFEISADLIYIDAGHGEYEVYGDIAHYWKVLRPGGIMFGDDYYQSWHGVIKAVNRFAAEHGLLLETSSGKWFMTKPA